MAPNNFALSKLRNINLSPILHNKKQESSKKKIFPPKPTRKQEKHTIPNAIHLLM